MRFLQLDLDAALTLDPQAQDWAGRRLVRLIAGNPVTMGQMTRHAPDAGSYAPVTILIQQAARRRNPGCIRHGRQRHRPLPRRGRLRRRPAARHRGARPPASGDPGATIRNSLSLHPRDSPDLPHGASAFALQPRHIAHMPAIGHRPPAPWQVLLAFPGAEAARRLHIREPHHGRVRKRHPEPRTVPGGVPDLEPARRRGGRLARRGQQRRTHHRNAERTAPNSVQATRQVDLDADTRGDRPPGSVAVLDT